MRKTRRIRLSSVTRFVQRRRSLSSEPSASGEKDRASSVAVDVLASEFWGPKPSPARPASTVVLLGARTGTMRTWLDELAGTHTPFSTNETVPHSRIGWLTSTQL